MSWPSGDEESVRMAILVEVPHRPEVLPTSEEIVAKLRRLSGEHFVEGMFRDRREWFGAGRKSGARKMRGLSKGDELFTVRDLRVKVFG